MSIICLTRRLGQVGSGTWLRGCCPRRRRGRTGRRRSEPRPRTASCPRRHLNKLILLSQTKHLIIFLRQVRSGQVTQECRKNNSYVNYTPCTKDKGKVRLPDASTRQRVPQDAAVTGEEPISICPPRLLITSKCC